MRRISLIVFSTLVLLVRDFPESKPATPGSIRSAVVAKSQNGEPAVLPDARVVLHGAVIKEAQSDAQGAFAIDGLPPGSYHIEANAPRLYAAFAVGVSGDTSSTVPIDVKMAAVTSTTSPQPRQLKAKDCAFGRKVHHA